MTSLQKEVTNVETAARVFCDDALLPSQYGHVANDLADPTSRISWALLVGAISDILQIVDLPLTHSRGGRKTSGLGKRAKVSRAREAYAWLMGAPAPLQMEDICSRLHIDEVYIRQEIQKILRDDERVRAAQKMLPQDESLN